MKIDIDLAEFMFAKTYERLNDSEKKLMKEYLDVEGDDDLVVKLECLNLIREDRLFWYQGLHSLGQIVHYEKTRRVDRSLISYKEFSVMVEDYFKNANIELFTNKNGTLAIKRWEDD